MKEKYAVYKKEWVEKMVDYLLKQLDINEEGAKEARKHPEDFHINYDTYKLLLSSESL